MERSMFIKKDQFETSILGYGLVEDALNKFGAVYLEVFNWKSSDIDKIVVIDDFIRMDISTWYSGCDEETDYITCPVSYLWDEDWIEKEKVRLAQEAEERKKRQEIRDAKRREENKEGRRKHYLELKEEFENETKA